MWRRKSKIDTGRSALDNNHNIHLMELIIKLEWVIPRAVKRGTQARLQHELKHEQEGLRDATELVRSEPG